MSKDVGYIDYIADGINNADGINDCIDIILEGKEKLEYARNNRNLESDTNKATANVPEDLVYQIRKSMEGKTPKSTKNVAEELETAIKERMAEGRNIHHAVLDDDGYKTYENDNLSKEDASEGEEIEI